MSAPLFNDPELVQQLENALAVLRGRAPHADATWETSDTPPLAFDLTEAAKALYWARRQRERYFGMLSETFSEPAWDLMLDLFIARREGRRVSVTSAAIAANVPTTTALRWILLLEEQDVIKREPDPGDRRRTWLCLQESAYRQMALYVGECVLAGPFGRAMPDCLSSVASA